MRWPWASSEALEGDVARHGLAAGLDDVDGADVPSRLPDRRGHLAEHAGQVGDPDAGGEAVAGDGRGLGHWCSLLSDQRRDSPPRR